MQPINQYRQEAERQNAIQEALGYVNPYVGMKGLFKPFVALRSTHLARGFLFNNPTALGYGMRIPYGFRGLASGFSQGPIGNMAGLGSGYLLGKAAGLGNVGSTVIGAGIAGMNMFRSKSGAGGIAGLLDRAFSSNVAKNINTLAEPGSLFSASKYAPVGQSILGNTTKKELRNLIKDRYKQLIKPSIDDVSHLSVAGVSFGDDIAMSFKPTKGIFGKRAAKKVAKKQIYKEYLKMSKAGRLSAGLASGLVAGATWGSMIFGAAKGAISLLEIGSATFNSYMDKATRLDFGNGSFIRTSQAQTERQAAIAAIQNTQLDARRIIGNEARLMHRY